MFIVMHNSNCVCVYICIRIDLKYFTVNPASEHRFHDLPSIQVIQM